MYTFLHLNVPEMRSALLALSVIAGGTIGLLISFAMLSAACTVAKERLRHDHRPMRGAPTTPQIACDNEILLKRAA